jgi:AAA+ superfamily predicted ATPase
MAEPMIRQSAATRERPSIFDEPVWQDLLPALRRLDARLERAIRLAQASYAPARAGEQFRGLYMSEEEVELLLARQPGEPLLYDRGEADQIAGQRIGRLQRAFGLTQFDLEVVLLALAPELDRRYERLYAYLQDNVNLRRPTVDLALQLLCADATERIERREHFAAEAALISPGLIHLRSDGEQGTLLAASLKLDDQVVAFLLRQDCLDARLAPHCRQLQGSRRLDELPLPAETARALASLARDGLAGRPPLRLHLHGPEGSGKTEAAAGLAAAGGRPLLVLDLASAARSGETARVVQLFAQAVRLRDATACFANADALLDAGVARSVTSLADGWPDTVIFTSAQPHLPLGPDTIEVAFGPLAFEESRRWWRDRLAAGGFAIGEAELDELAGKLELTVGQVDEAISRAAWRARWRRASAEESGQRQPSVDLAVAELYEAACERSTAELATLARRVRPTRRWDDIVLPPDTRAQLQELCSRVSRRRRVLDEWGFRRQLTLGRGTVALFTGGPGTGKTLAAEIVASDLKLDLCKVDLSGVVSKYIGETEKNLSRIFAAAERANAILFFDEADALFGKRSEVRDSHDRYANIETSYLLQKMEEYDGVAILATNLRQNLDESFIRRIAFTVHFPFPDEASRLDIWRTVWPLETPLADDVDLGLLAGTFKLAGGNIKNIAIAAAFLAAEDGQVVTMAGLLHATRREYQKLGKALSETELAIARV